MASRGHDTQVKYVSELLSGKNKVREMKFLKKLSFEARILLTRSRQISLSLGGQVDGGRTSKIVQHSIGSFGARRTSLVNDVSHGGAPVRQRHRSR